MTETFAHISAVQEDIVRLRLDDPARGRLMKNEVVYIRPRRAPEERLKAEVLRVLGHPAPAPSTLPEEQPELLAEHN